MSHTTGLMRQLEPGCVTIMEWPGPFNTHQRMLQVLTDLISRELKDNTMFSKHFRNPDAIVSTVDGNVIVPTKCPFCLGETKVVITVVEYENWKSGMLIQKAMPTQSADTRELLITGICNKCFPSEE